MWKELFRFTSVQRTTMLLLAVALLLLVAIDYFIYREREGQVGSRMELDAEAWHKVKKLEESQRGEKQGREGKSMENVLGDRMTPVPIRNERFFFDPNTLDSSSFVRMGLHPWQAHNIMLYRQRGGRYRKASDFSRMYGLSSSQYESLRPYIKIREESDAKSEWQAEEIRKEEKPTVVRVELNTMDTLALQQIMKPSVARQIVSYGRRLGGYVSTEQLYEALSWADSRYVDKLRTSIVADTSLVRRINVNRATVEQMQRHPYISYRQARAIYEYRKTHGHMSSLEEMRGISELTSEFWQRAMPYLTVR